MSAIGQVCDLYVQNHRLLEDWAIALDVAHLPIWRGYRLTHEDRIRRAVIRALMCRGDLELDRIGERFDLDFRTHFAAELESLGPLAEDGLVEIEPGRIHVTPLGRLLVRAIAMRFDAYLNREPSSGKRAFSRVI